MAFEINSALVLLVLGAFLALEPSGVVQSSIPTIEIVLKTHKIRVWHNITTVSLFKRKVDCVYHSKDRLCYKLCEDF